MEKRLIGIEPTSRAWKARVITIIRQAQSLLSNVLSQAMYVYRLLTNIKHLVLLLKEE